MVLLVFSTSFCSSLTFFNVFVLSSTFFSAASSIVCPILSPLRSFILKPFLILKLDSSTRALKVLNSEVISVSFFSKDFSLAIDSFAAFDFLSNSLLSFSFSSFLIFSCSLSISLRFFLSSQPSFLQPIATCKNCVHECPFV